MKIKSPAFVISSILGIFIISNPAIAELKLPAGSDRRPDLTLDPFERAREAMRKLPQSTEEKAQEPAPQPEIKKQPEVKKQPEPVVEAQQAQPQDNAQAETTLAEEPAEPFTYEFAVTVDTLSKVSGGLAEPNEGAFEQNTTGVFGVADFIAEVDTSGAKLWDDGLFHLYTGLMFGAAPYVGDIHGTSGIYGAANSMRIMEAWYEHSFPYSHSSFLFGWQDFTSEFYLTEYATLFLNGGLGGGLEIMMGAVPSTYPITTLGFRYKTKLNDSSYFQIGMYDGAASEDALNKLIEVGLNKDDGVFVISETGYLNGEPGEAGYMKIGLGLWYLRKWNYGFETAEVVVDEETKESRPKLLLEDNPKPHNSGAYIVAEAAIGERLGIFFQHGRARAEYNQIAQFYAAGINYTGIVPGREEDILGLALVHSRNSSAFLAAQPDDALLFVAETAFEITYTTQITEWLMLQPDIQYIQQPGMDPNLPNATVIGIRAQAVF